MLTKHSMMDFVLKLRVIIFSYSIFFLSYDILQPRARQDDEYFDGELDPARPTCGQNSILFSCQVQLGSAEEQSHETTEVIFIALFYLTNHCNLKK